MERATGSEISRLAKECRSQSRSECIAKLKEEMKNRNGVDEQDDDASEVERVLEYGSSLEASRFLHECTKRAKRSNAVKENIEKCRTKFGERMNEGRGKFGNVDTENEDSDRESAIRR